MYNTEVICHHLQCQLKSKNIILYNPVFFVFGCTNYGCRHKPGGNAKQNQKTWEVFHLEFTIAVQVPGNREATLYLGPVEVTRAFCQNSFLNKVHCMQTRPDHKAIPNMGGFPKKILFNCFTGQWPSAIL